MPHSLRLLGCALAAAAMVLAGCGSAQDGPPKAVIKPPAKVVDDGYLTYGTAASFPPFEYKSDGEPTGFDIEMGRHIAGYLGLSPKPMDMDFDGLVPALSGGRIDVINSAMYINKQRAKQVDFIPYMQIGESVLTRKGDSSIKKVPEDLSGKTVAVTRGAIGETYMKDFNKQLAKLGKKPMTIMTLPNNQDALLALQSKRADAFDTSTPGAAYTLSKTKGIQVGATFALGTKIGIAVPKGNAEMKKAMEKAVRRFVKSGEYAALLKKYNLPEDVNIFRDQASKKP